VSEGRLCDPVAERPTTSPGPSGGPDPEGIEGSPIAVAGQGDAHGRWEGFGLAEMQIGKQQQPLGRHPTALLRQSKLQRLPRQSKG